MGNARARFPDLAGVILTIPPEMIPVTDEKGVHIGVVTGMYLEGDDVYVDMLIDPEVSVSSDFEWAGTLTHVSTRRKHG